MSEGKIDRIFKELHPAYDLDRLEEVTKLGMSPRLVSAYNGLQGGKHLCRGTVAGVLVALAANVDSNDVVSVAGIFAVIDVIQYALRAVLELEKRGY